MDGGDRALGLRRGNVLDPSAQEFHPTPYSFSLPSPQIYYTYPPPPPLPLPPPPPPMHLLQPPPPSPSPPPAATRARPSYVSHGPAEALPDAVPTRSLLLSSVPSTASEGLVRMELECFGGVRAVDMSRLAPEGIVTVHFYDLRAARAAMDAVRAQHVRHQGRVWQHLHGGAQFPPWEVPLGVGLVGGSAVWAHFALEPAATNNGSLVVFNLDPTVSSRSLRDVFQAFGAVKETRETPMKPRHRFVEFFDTRDAARALVELNGKDLFGRKVVIEFSRPGGHGRSNYSRKSPSHASPAPPRLPAAQPPPSPLPRSASNISSSSSEGGECCGSRGKSSGGSPVARSRPRSFKNLQRCRSGGRAGMDERFLIKAGGDPVERTDGSSSSGDTRTTVMIKNIPNKYSQKLLLDMLDNHCAHCNELIVSKGEQAREPLSSYDFVYLPIDFNNKCNVGYGFVNMTSPEAAWRLYKAFHLQAWTVFNSRKICQITYARLQGLDALLEHFRNSKFACDNDEYMPVFFSPPRDGANSLTEPATVGGRSPASASPLPKMVLLRVNSDEADADADAGGGSSTSSKECRESDDE